MLAEIGVFETSLGEIPVAKKTGKNMDMSPYVRLVVILLVKTILVLAAALIAMWLVIRWRLRKR